MSTYERVIRCVDIAFTIYGSGKDGMFWLNRATAIWRAERGDEPIPGEVWVLVAEMLRLRHATLIDAFPRMRQFVDDPTGFEFPG
jgi:hypothetical protein